ncbi:MAG: protein translocase subunit SecD [Thermoguttaceae bacterium]|jgi:SecD/SecF fusion protein
MSGYITLLVMLAIVIVPMLLGGFLARLLRMPDYGWKIWLILFAASAGVAELIYGWPPKLGPDLSGGVILIYQVDPTQMQPGQTLDGQKMAKMVDAVQKRVNPGGQLEVKIQTYGNDSIEVTLPRVDKEETDRIKEKISSVGTLEFRILANNRDHRSLIERAQSESSDKLFDSEGNLLAWWVPVSKGEERSFAGDREIAVRTPKDDEKHTLEVLVVKDDYDVKGNYLRQATASIDPKTGAPDVLFTFNTEGGRLFGELTGNNLPDKASDFSRKLGIILDGEMRSAPTIQSTIFDSGQITGSFTQKQVDDLVDVLNAGSLPAALTKEPVSQLYTGATLGSDTIHKSAVAMIISAILVPLFMVWYYRFAGLVANVALVLNMVLLVAIMIAVNAAFTLPGLAGLALTVGMAVDNNVLIYERLREELRHGAALRMAIRNAFHRAGVVIIDANVTHLMAATVLWVVGSDQVKGFAITFWLGAVLSLWTSLFVARVIFEVAERRGWIREKLKMLHVIGDTYIDFMNWFPACATFSVTITVLGLAVAFYRGKGLFDIDFTGGVSVEAVFREPYDVGKIRTQLEDRLNDLAVSEAWGDPNEEGRRFIINTSTPDLHEVGVEIKEAFGDKLLSNAVKVSRVARIESAAEKPVEPKGPLKPAEKKPADLKSGNLKSKNLKSGNLKSSDLKSENLKSERPVEKKPAKAAEPKSKEQSRRDLPAGTFLALADRVPLVLAQASDAAKPAAKPPAEAKPSAAAKPPAEAKPETRKPALVGPPRPAAAATGEKAALVDPFAGGTQAGLTFDFKVNHSMIKDEVDNALEANGIQPEDTPYELALPNQPYVEGDSTSYETWILKSRLSPEKAHKVLASIQAQVKSEPYFPGASKIGGAVAENTRYQAMWALLGSWTLIILYLWIRFQGVAFGLAAVIALIHDVLVMLGAIAFSLYIAPAFGWLLIDPFKINLPIVAAFLTIIGYSVNDTIVVFDRIREVRGKAPRITRQMINDSTNQTLSRTLLTSFTVFLVVVILYFFGGQAIHGFAFALIIGVATGTYSSIYVAAPILLWMVHPKEMKRNDQREVLAGRE